MSASDQRFIHLGYPKVIWAVPAIHGQVDRLRSLHDIIGRYFVPGDKIVYLGNYLGYGGDPLSTIDEVLYFRRNLLAMRGMLANDLIYLRGAQEEMWQKLLQIQFAKSPQEVLEWLLENGVEPTLQAYGSSANDGRYAAREGIMALTRWTCKLKENIRKKPGHDKFATVLKRAAFTEDFKSEGVLFVPAGIDVTRPLVEQEDSFWWASSTFQKIDQPYGPFQKIIRGFDPAGGGFQKNCYTLTLDGGCGFGGPLVCGRLTGDGQLLDVIEA